MTKGKDTARKLVRLILRRVPSEKNKLIATGEVIGFLAYLYRKSRDVRNFFLSPFVPHEAKENFLREILSKFGAPEGVLEVLRYMIETHSMSLLPDMKKAYDHEVERIMRMSKGHLYIAKDVGKEEIEKIKATIQKILGRDLDIDVAYDPDLIGGFLFKTSGFVVDTSVKRHLERLLIGG